MDPSLKASGNFAPQIPEAQVTDVLATNFGLSAEAAQGLIDQANSGVEANHGLIEGTFSGMHTTPSDRPVLDKYYGPHQSTWNVIDQDGRPFHGTPSTELRDETGAIANPGFIDELTSRGVAVETGVRGASGEIPVNHIWRLASDPDGRRLPVAAVRTIDADASTTARGGSNARPIAIGERVVVFPGLRLPEPRQQQ